MASEYHFCLINYESDLRLQRIYRASTLRNKFEIRSTKEAPRTETNLERNKSQIGKIQNTESEGSLFGILEILVIRICFEFRASDFEFSD